MSACWKSFRPDPLSNLRPNELTAEFFFISISFVAPTFCSPSRIFIKCFYWIYLTSYIFYFHILQKCVYYTLFSYISVFHNLFLKISIFENYYFILYITCKWWIVFCIYHISFKSWWLFFLLTSLFMTL